MLKTSEFDAWLSDLRDRQGVARIAARIDRLAESWQAPKPKAPAKKG